MDNPRKITRYSCDLKGRGGNQRCFNDMNRILITREAMALRLSDMNTSNRFHRSCASFESPHLKS